MDQVDIKVFILNCLNHQRKFSTLNVEFNKKLLELTEINPPNRSQDVNP